MTVGLSTMGPSIYVSSNRWQVWSRRCHISQLALQFLLPVFSAASGNTHCFPLLLAAVYY